MICRGCQKERKLIKAHIIPESFFRGLREGKLSPEIHSTAGGFYPKKAPIGVYDKEILCNECEQIFQKYDDYGCQILIKNESNFEPLDHEGKHVGYRINSIDNKKLKLFFLSVLWRASISRHYFYSRVALNKLENKLKELIWNNNPGGKHDFSFALGKFEDDGAGRTIQNPFQERFWGIRYYRFYMYGYVLYIKSDSQKTPPILDKLIPDDDSLIVVTRGTIEDSKEYKMLLAAAKNDQRT